MYRKMLMLVNIAILIILHERFFWRKFLLILWILYGKQVKAILAMINFKKELHQNTTVVRSENASSVQMFQCDICICDFFALYYDALYFAPPRKPSVPNQFATVLHPSLTCNLQSVLTFQVVKSSTLFKLRFQWNICGKDLARLRPLAVNKHWLNRPVVCFIPFKLTHICESPSIRQNWFWQHL